MKRLILAIAFAALSTAACSGGLPIHPDHPVKPVKGSSEIVGGTLDTGHPAVVLLVFTIGANSFVCSGTVIGPSVILTAAHCTVTDEACVQPNCTTLTPAGASYIVAAGADPFTAGADWFFGPGTGSSGPVHDIITNPNYDGQNFVSDTGIVILGDIAPTTPMPYLHAGTATTEYNAGTAFTAVGFGITSGAGQDSGKKRTVGLTIQSSDSQIFQFGSATKNICGGDSGGPALEGGVVVGTVSYGDQNCTSFGADMRTDDEDTFISLYANTTVTPLPTPTPSHTPTPTPAPGDTPSGKKDPISQLKKSLHCSVESTNGDPTAGALAAITLLAGLVIARRRKT